MSKGDVGPSCLDWYSEKQQLLHLQYLETDLGNMTWQVVTISVERPFCFLISSPTEVLARIWYEVDACEIIKRVHVRTDLLARHRQLFHSVLPRVETVFERLRPYLERL